jgi:hypothetical protein
MHAFLVFGILFMSTASPANWEPVARNRQQYARFLWMQINTLSRGLARGLPHLPKLLFAPPASQETVKQFVQATPDSLNTGVLDKHGARLPPQYDHHVDDCLYADVKEFPRLPLQRVSLCYTFCSVSRAPTIEIRCLGKNLRQNLPIDVRPKGLLLIHVEWKFPFRTINGTKL